MIDNVGTTPASRSLVAFVFLMGLALVIYTPWQAVPFDILDFSELLPILRGSDTFLDSLRDVVGYYRGHGRSNPITSAFIALNWELFGETPLAWRLFRTVLMGIALAFTLRFLARLGFSTPALVGGAAIVVVGLSAAGNWLRLTGEPIAYLCLILALGIAAGYRDRERWGWRLAALASVVLVLLVTKETMIAVVPALAAVASFADSRFEVSKPATDARTWSLWVVLLGVTVTFAACAWWIATSADTGAYVETYGRRGIDLTSFAVGLQRISFPMGNVGGALVWWNVLFGVFTVAGCTVACLGPEGKRARVLIALGSYLILAGSVVYLPWGRFEYFYGLPFSLGTILLVAVATEELTRRAGANRSMVFGVLTVVLTIPAALSQLFAARTYALREVNWAIADELSRFVAADSFVVAVEGLSAQPWQGRAATLRRVGTLLQPPSAGPLPPAVDRECQPAMELADGAPFRVVVLSYDPGCGPVPDPVRTWVQGYDYAKLLGFAAAHEEIRAYLAEPAVDSLNASGSPQTRP